MHTLSATSTQGHKVTLDSEAVDDFQNRLRGPLLRPEDDGYDEARQVWNAMIDRKPALIAQCAGVADMIASVNFAREHDLLLAVKGGGHNVAGTAVCDGGLVIDLSRMRGVRVDLESRTARVQAGATWADLDHETQAFGLATPGGVVSDTGVAGLTLGGGIGHLRCKHGLSCDNLQSVELVTADGEPALTPLQSFAEPITDFSGTMPYVEFQQLLDEDYPNGMRYYWKSLYLDALSDAAIDRIAYWADTAPSPLSTVDVWQLGGAIADVDVMENAFANRHAPFLLGVEANWKASVNDDANVEWVRDCIEDMRQFTGGREYLNFPGFLEGGDETLKKSFGDNYDRLVELKNKYDPENLFRMNQNIPPAAPAQPGKGSPKIKLDSTRSA